MIGIEVDKKAKRILFNYFWKNGWIDDSKMHINEEDFLYAKEKGLMFDFSKEIIKYDELIKNISNLIKEIDFNDTVKAFLCSLSSRAIHLRSFVSSYYLAQKIISYDFSKNENIEKEFYNKYNIMIDDFHLEYQNVYNFEKYKWGGVRLEQLSYIYFDLREFSKIDFEFNPTKEDINIFNAILEKIDSYNMKNDSANKMQKVLKDILKSSKYERIILLEILAYLDILEAKEERDYRDTELSENLMNWRGGDSYSKINAQNIFGNYLLI
ncbi:hypothetical protein JQ824_06660 [Brachyspira hyodysenteriae]|uniref:Uncharacterized protein n=1 Tax=Brachyspira hyodysenteriae (strain ATCC 49526 / WA1) TaxID=565034 RepID=A0A3B6VC95_BRAHW|nr:hypothetical protein [Brachyspira hyodysenteriae]ACN84992.1 hypothetical protein BHWA1_02539 [Brachyspira hyodysenteriae WA1]AUJ50711.1 hypothetical protein BH718_02282 [Brachyspira hyodysenteriae]KLI13549.1 hypothetical protein SU45_13620 [Brachyspira hyodysenteriae]KLI19635.1 hypothetical protein SU46_05990 [Brachyspira hyodysenteriae]KLI37140.1 hypothetical protein SZ51_10895 [Brachyspira hyodysenteriae]